jgi:RNase P subunit RPR2
MEIIMIQEDSNTIEICVNCGTPTSYKKSDNITFRYDYIEGIGQLCFNCNHQTRKVHKSRSYNNDLEWIRYD